MSKIDERNALLANYTTDAEAIKAKIADIADNKGITVEYGVDTPLSLLTKIDNGTVANPSISVTKIYTLDCGQTDQVALYLYNSNNTIIDSIVIGPNVSGSSIGTKTITLTQVGTYKVTIAYGEFGEIGNSEEVITIGLN